ncbi:MAG TPA: M56 family metallopeptidase, partial [Kofleriaceae bacterium]|nr:M56 family metallopeptidase [Kofleriaceae bacterium]
LDLALAHELAHLRRRDWIARWLHAAVAAVWFFLPIRILIGRSLERAQEAAADALAARALSLSPPVYARRLVDATLRCQGQAGRPLVGVLALAAPAALVERIEALCLRRSLATTGLGGAAFVVAFGVLGLGQPRAAAPAQAVAQCDYSPAIAEALREVHPEADLDGDGELARDEACALQEQLRRVARDGVEPGAEQASAEPLWQRLCCNCEVSGTSEGRDARDLYEERSEPLADPGGPGACEQE